MSSEAIHSAMVSSASLALMIVIFVLAQRQKISFRYAAGWLILLAFGLMGGIVVPLIAPLADYLNLAPVSIVAGSGVLVLLVICIQLTVSISGLQNQVRRLAEQIALNDLETKQKLELTNE